MTQAALARKAGISERNIVRWENEQHAPRAEHVAAIARATGRDTDYFLAEEDTAASDDEEESDAVADLVRALRRVVSEKGIEV